MIKSTDTVHPVPATIVPHTPSGFGVCAPTGNNYTGINLRTELAARAMQGLCAKETCLDKEIPKRAVAIADALIAELNKTSDHG